MPVLLYARTIFNQPPACGCGIRRNWIRRNKCMRCCTSGFQGAASHASSASLSMSAAVEGLGPRFRLLLTVINEGAAAVGGLVVVLQYDMELYRWGCVGGVAVPCCAVVGSAMLCRPVTCI